MSKSLLYVDLSSPPVPSVRSDFVCFFSKVWLTGQFICICIASLRRRPFSPAQVSSLPESAAIRRSWRSTSWPRLLLAFLGVADCHPPLMSQPPVDEQNTRERELAKQLIPTFIASKDDSVWKCLNPEAFVNKWLLEGTAMGK